MESHLASQETLLIDNLSFVPSHSADYVIGRKKATFYQAGSNVYTPVGGTRVLKISLNSSSDWIDPSCVYLQYDSVNKQADAKHIRTISNGHSFFRRLRVMAGNSVLEDISDYNKVAELFENAVETVEGRDNDDVHNFGYHLGGAGLKQADISNTTAPGIAQNKKRTVSIRPLCGILRQPKYLCLKYMQSLTFEFELVNSLDDVILSAHAGSSTGTSWEIQNPCIQADLCQIDNALQNRFDQHMLEGKNISIPYQQIITSTQTTTASKDIQINITRSCSRLQQVYMTMFRASAVNDFVDRKNFNTFYHPMGIGAATVTNGSYDSDAELQLQLQIGSKSIPERPIESVSQAYYNLKKALGKKTVGIKQSDYIVNKFAYGLDLEAVPGVLGQGLNTRQGDLMTIKLKSGSSIEAKMPTELTVYLVAQSVLELSDAGSNILD